MFFLFDFSIIFPRNSCFLCALCGNVTAFFSSAPKYTVQNILSKRQVCTELGNVMIEKNLLHKFDAKSTLCNVVMKDFPLLSHICIRTWPFCFSVTWCPSATSMYLTYLVLSLELNPKLLVSCGTLLPILESNWSIANCHHTFHFCVPRCYTFMP